LNDNIQKLCKNVGLDTEVNVIKVVGGEKKNVYGASKKKYEVVTSHVGRHTFVTLCTNELGLQDETIRIFSGHSGGDSLQRYKHNIELRAVKILNDAMNDFIEETGFHPDK
jgi:integrase